jgi:hypothetical protein
MNGKLAFLQLRKGRVKELEILAVGTQSNHD